MAAFPDGHFYSPIVDHGDVRRRREAIWAPREPSGVAIDYRPAAQSELLHQLRCYATDFDYPERKSGDGFFQANGKFEGLDARLWFCLLRHIAPARVIEVGSGFTTLLATDVNRRFLEGNVRLTSIDPYPAPFVRPLAGSGLELVESPVQDVPMRRFEELNSGDVLFIDSSHVSKTGSDVNFLYLEVLPRLAEGVVIHVHDIFLPDEYPADWVLEEERSWNEQYLVQALLTYTYGLEIVAANHFAATWLPELIAETFGLHCGGGSLWLRKMVPAL